MLKLYRILLKTGLYYGLVRAWDAHQAAEMYLEAVGYGAKEFWRIESMLDITDWRGVLPAHYQEMPESPLIRVHTWFLAEPVPEAEAV